MNLAKRHPEAHDAWLYAMGIDVRWRHRSGNQLDGAPEMELPECIIQSRYWLIGEQVLTEPQLYLLAGMMWAVGVQSVSDCVYSYSADATQTHPSPMATGGPFLDTVNVLGVEPKLLETPADAFEHTTLIVFGDVLMSGVKHQRLLRLPSVQAMIENPLLKKQAWLTLCGQRT
jgi:hypothetical protein